MGRRRRRVIRRVKKTLPKFFKCPRCGMDSVRAVKRKEEGSSEQEYYFIVACGNCGLRSEYRGEITVGREPIDFYNMFVDAFHRGELT